MSWYHGLVNSNVSCVPVNFGSLIYRTGSGSSFPNLGSAGNYPLTVFSSPISDGDFTLTSYNAETTSIPRSAVGYGTQHTVIIREFGNIRRLCALANAHTGGSPFFTGISIADGAELLTGGGAQIDAGSVSAQVGVFYFGGSFCTDSYMDDGRGVGGGPVLTEYDGCHTPPPYSGYPAAVSCTAALFPPCITVQICNTGFDASGSTSTPTPPAYSGYTHLLYVNGALVSSYCCVTEVAPLSQYPFTSSNFGVRLYNADDPTWSQSVLGFAMFRRSCLPWTVAETGALVAEYLAA